MNTDIYGIKEKTETDQSKGTKAELLRWAQERIKNHCEPSVTVTVTALDLSEATGESIDHITIGAMCRMPLAKYNTTVQEIITKISYQNKLQDPYRASVTMANIREDVASIINNLIKSGGGGGRAAAKNAEEDHAWFVDTTDHVAMIAEGVAGEGAAQDWSRVAELLVDGNGIHQRVTQAQQDIVNAYSVIDQTTTAIRIEIGTVASEVRSFILQTPDMIHTEVGYAVSGMTTSVIEQTATYIRTEIENAASEISQTVIEQTVEYIQTTVEATASNVAWSVITQTMTNIEQRVARKSTTYTQPTDPNDGTNVIQDGDIWIKRENKKTWDELANTPWNATANRPWESFYGDYIYTWKDGAWRFVKNTAVDVENEVKLEQTGKSIAMIGHAVDAAGNVFNSNLEVTARQIRSEVSTAEGKLNSAIEQTSTYIRSQVTDRINGLQSVIEQTASQIRTEVSNSVSNLQSSITQQADRISLVVEGTGDNAHIKPAQIVAAINRAGSTVKISANHIELDGETIAQGIYSQAISCSTITSRGQFQANGNAFFDMGIYAEGDVDCNRVIVPDGRLKVGNHEASWKSMSFVRITSVSPSRRWLYAGSSGTTPSGALLSNVIASYDNKTIYYLGR